MGAPRACLIFITFHLLSLATAQEVSKRVPQGFLGMRGKKYFDDEGTEQFYKRKPQFFVGVKGKKSLQDMLESSEQYSDQYKRAPMGFVGMRGKKEAQFSEFDNSNDVTELKRDVGSLIGKIDYASSESHKGPELPLFDELLMRYLANMDVSNTIPAESLDDIEPFTNEVDKRGSNIHQFFGVRGKKSMNNKRPYDVTFRGKFIGVRGKKDLKNSGPHEVKFLLDQNGPLPKRKAQMGFFGMRGKKWNDESSFQKETAF